MFKVEDGTGYSDSTSYVDVAYADTYIAFYYPDDTEWSAKTTAEKELALITATNFVDRLLKWRGSILVETQALSWPRTEFKDAEGRLIEEGTIPTKIKDSVVIMALESLTADIYDEGVLLTSQEYGSSSETYAGPVRDGGSRAATMVAKDLKYSGYGVRYSSLITIHRA